MIIKRVDSLLPKRVDSRIVDLLPKKCYNFRSECGYTLVHYFKVKTESRTI